MTPSNFTSVHDCENSPVYRRQLATFVLQLLWKWEQAVPLNQKVCKGLVAITLISLRRRRRKGVREHASILWLMNAALWRALRRPIVKHHCLAACCHGNTLTLAAGLKCCSQKWQMLCQEKKTVRKERLHFYLDSAERIEIQFGGCFTKQQLCSQRKYPLIGVSEDICKQFCLQSI